MQRSNIFRPSKMTILPLKLMILVMVTLSSLTAYGQTDSISHQGGFLKLKEHTIDFGRIPGDSIVKGSFTIYNIGNDTVSITNVISGCSCAASYYKRQPIAPGDSLELTVTYDPRDYSGGSFRRIFRVRSNAENPYLSAVIKGTVTRKKPKRR